MKQYFGDLSEEMEEEEWLKSCEIAVNVIASLTTSSDATTKCNKVLC